MSDIRSTNYALSVEEWVAERHANCLRIAKREFDEDRAGWLEDAAFFQEILAQLVRLAAAEAEIERLRLDLRLANTGGLDLLYRIRAALGWTDKHSLELLPGECERLCAQVNRPTAPAAQE